MSLPTFTVSPAVPDGAPAAYAAKIAPCKKEVLANDGSTGTMALDNAITIKTPKKRVSCVLMAALRGLNHAVCFQVHGRVRFDMEPLVDGTCQIDRVVLITVDAEDLFRAGLDLAYEIHQLPAI